MRSLRTEEGEAMKTHTLCLIRGRSSFAGLLLSLLSTNIATRSEAQNIGAPIGRVFGGRNEIAA